METTIPEMIGDYQVIKTLGRGGMGEVLLAQDDSGQRVAIKRPLASVSADGLSRFRVEGKASVLDHPNIATVFKAGLQNDGRPYLAMEFIDGIELKQLIDSGKTLDLLFILQIIKQVCDGLGYAHRMGFVHRDIKPGNVMIPRNAMVQNGDAVRAGASKIVAKVIDFGIAKITNAEMTTDQTQASQLIGSLYYIAPERFKGEAMDGRVDVFSAGVMLYLMLTGRLPFTGGEETAQYQIVNQAHTSLGSHIRDYPPALDGILDQALAKNPDDRFATAEDFSDALLDVIEEEKQSRLTQLLNDAERLTMEARYEPALALLDEAIQIDEAHTQVRKLKRFILDKQKQDRKAEQIRELTAKADGFLAAEKYAEALAQLKEAFRIDPSFPGLKDRVASVEATKQRYEKSLAALAEAEAAKKRGDVTAALRIAEHAVQEDPDNTKLLALRAAIANQLEREKQQEQVTALLSAARSELAARSFPAVDRLLGEAEAIDRSHPRIEELRREMARMREQEDRRQLLEEVQRRVNDYLRADNYEQAVDLLTRAIDKLPGEIALHRLKMEVDTAARKFDSARFVDRALASAQEAFAADPDKAITILHQALEQMPGDERLIAYERSLRMQADVVRAKQLLNQALRSAQDFFAAAQFDKAIDVLESYQLEHGAQADVDELLNFSRLELASQQRRALVDRTAVEARALIGEGRLEEAVRLLESTLQTPGMQGAGDRTLSGLLEGVRAQLQTATRKREAVLKRAATLRERGELDEAIQHLSDYLASGTRTAEAEELLSSLQAERASKQVTAQAIAAAEQSARQANFPAALESLQAVVRAYGESEELTRATQQVERARAAHAQQVVSKSIEASRAALLANDVPGAMAALRAANEMVEFADAAKQADWRRIGQAAKKAQSQPTGTIIADPLADLPEAATARKPASPLILGLGALAVCAVLAVVGFFLLHKSTPPVLPTQVSIAKAPPGALVSIDGGAGQATDANGSLTLAVSPGSHEIEVTKDGYDTWRDSFPVAAGTTFRENAPMIKQPPKENSGTLVMSGTQSDGKPLAAFKVTVDGQYRGEYSKNNYRLSLEAGKPHTVVYTNVDGMSPVTHTNIEIAAGNSRTDQFTLNPPAPPPTQQIQKAQTPVTPPLAPASVVVTPPAPPQGPPQSPPPAPAITTGSLSIQGTPGAQVSLKGPNGQYQAIVNGLGVAAIPGINPGTYSLVMSKEGFQDYIYPRGIQISASSVSQSMITPDLQQPTKQVVNPVQAPPTQTPAPAPTAVNNHDADISGINDAINSFKAAYTRAYESKTKTHKTYTWDGIPPAWINGLEGLFDLAHMAPQIQENGCSRPEWTDNGNGAKEHCTESAKFDSNLSYTHAVTLIFAKTGGTWKLISKTTP